MKEINLRHSKNELAQRRWKILARALFKNVAVDDVIFSSKFHSFNLFKVCAIEIKDNEKSEWFRYSAFINDVLIFVKIRHLSNRTITRDELVGFNNTGNLCVWPSEEVLAYYVICNKSLFDNKKVLEVGGGMTCLSAVLIAKYTNCLCTHMSDGNECSVQNVSRIVKENGIDKFNVSCFVLKWNSYQNHTEKYDVILCADCIFFEESRSDLINTLWHLLLNSGIAIITAPKRDSSLAKFLAEVVQIGFNYSLYCYYNDQVWKKHVQFLECDENYNPNIDYPLLIILTKTEYWVSQSRKFCEFCKCWITDNKPSIQFHENGKKHKENVQIRLKEISKKSAQDQKAQAKADQDMKKMEKEALKAYLKDVESNPDFTSRMLLEKKKLEQEPQKSSKSGPSCTENLSTNQNSEKQKIPPKIWYEAKSDENYTYYWNIETGESKWEIPDGGFLSLEEQQKMSESKKSNTEDKQHGNSNKTSKLAEKSQPKNKKKSEKHETSDKLQSEESKLIGPIEKPDPYGAWTDVKKEEIDVSELGLPQTEYVAIKVPSLQESEPKITFKEKTITSLYNKSQISMVEDIPIKSEEPQFKRRKITKGNIRQRTDD